MITTASNPYSKRFAFSALCGICFVLTFCFSDVVIEHMSAGLMLCAKTIIPSLFPFMIISELIIYSGFGESLGKLFKPFTKTLFGISDISACCVILGAMCGFPIGAKTAISLLDNDHISKKEAQRLISFCNNPSSAFILNVVGVTLYNNKSIGAMFYTITLINACIIGIGWNLIYGKCANMPRQTHTSSQINIIPIFTTAVSNATKSILTVCSYIVFFSSLMGCIRHCLNLLKLPPQLNTLIYGFVELSGGVNASSNLGITTVGIGITAFIIGWSGLSVHFQIISLCQNRKLKFKGYFISKLIHGILNVILSLIVYTMRPDIFAPNSTDTTIPSLFRIYPIWQNISLMLFALSILIYFYKAIHKSTVQIIY